MKVVNQNLRKWYGMITLSRRKNIRIRSYSGPYSVRMQESTDQNICEHGHFQAVIFTSWKLFQPFLNNRHEFKIIYGFLQKFFLNL